jgi:hypothetical protein
MRCVPGAAQHGALFARSGALLTRDRFGLWRSRISDAPLRDRSRCIASGTRNPQMGREAQLEQIPVEFTHNLRA